VLPKKKEKKKKDRLADQIKKQEPTMKHISLAKTYTD
jgi:hypothetical protein